MILLRLIVAGALGFGLLLVVVVLSAMWQARSRDLPHADVILVLGAGMDPDGRIQPPGVARVEKGVELWNQGVAPRIVVSGGPVVPGGVTAAVGMTRLAVDGGVPAEAIGQEGASWSTLQNALMSRPLVGNERVILVTHGYHMARSRVTARWAGLNVVGHACPSAFSPTTPIWSVVREGMAIPFNLVRVAIWHIWGWTGASEDDRMPLLARRLEDGRQG